MNQNEFFEKRVKQWQRLWLLLGIAMMILSGLAALAWIALELFGPRM